MKNTALLLAFFLCLTTSNSFCAGGKDIKEIKKDTAEIKQVQAVLKGQFDNFPKDPSSSAETLKQINDKLTQLQVHVNSLEEQFDGLKGQVNSLEKKVDDLAQIQPPGGGDQLAGKSNRVMYNGSLRLEAVAGFICSRNLNETLEDIMELLRIYKELADREGVNYDIAIAQMCRATNYLEWGKNSFNYAGFYSTGNTIKFNNKREGVLAHIQHLKAYASPDAIPRNQLIDPRYDIIEQKGYRNSVVFFDQLYAKWSPLNESVYRRDITEILTNLYKASDSYR
jgi:TolA-binding protein